MTEGQDTSIAGVPGKLVNIVVDKLTGQPAIVVILLALFSLVSYGTYWAINKASVEIPLVIEQIQKGYETIDQRHREDSKQMRDEAKAERDSWGARLDKFGDKIDRVLDGKK